MKVVEEKMIELSKRMRRTDLGGENLWNYLRRTFPHHLEELESPPKWTKDLADVRELGTSERRWAGKGRSWSRPSKVSRRS